MCVCGGVIVPNAPESHLGSGERRLRRWLFWKKDKKKKSCLCVTCVLSHPVCAEAFNPDEDEEEKEPLVIIASFKRSFLLKIRADSSETFDGVAPGFAGHAPQNRRAEAETAGGLLGHPPLQESGSSESSSRRPTLHVATGTLPFLIPVKNICQPDRRRCRRCWTPCLRSSSPRGSTSSTRTTTGTTSMSSKGDFFFLDFISLRHVLIIILPHFVFIQWDLQHFREDRQHREAGRLL